MIGYAVLARPGGALGRCHLLPISLFVCMLALTACNRPQPVLDASVVQVQLPGRTGSGFALNRNGDVITAFHLIEGLDAYPERITVIETRQSGGPPRKVDRIPWSSRQLDIAIIHVNGLAQPPAPLQAGEPRKGEPVYAVGFPRLLSNPIATPWDPAVLEGTVTRIRTDTWDRLRTRGAAGASGIRIIEHSATLYPGNSGGPLVNACGAVVGINTAGAFLGQDGGQGADSAATAIRGASYATDTSVLTPELDRLDIRYEVATTSCGGSPTQPWLYMVAGAALAAIVLLSRPRRGHIPHDGLAPDWMLSGVARDGRAISVSVRKVDLAKAKGGLTIGRDPQRCEIVIDDPTVSGHHARLRMNPIAGPDPDSFLLEDLRSTNGTFVNGKRVAPGPNAAVLLPVGATLVIGGCRMRFTHG